MIKEEWLAQPTVAVPDRRVRRCQKMLRADAQCSRPASHGDFCAQHKDVPVFTTNHRDLQTIHLDEFVRGTIEAPYGSARWCEEAVRRLKETQDAAT